MNVDSRDNEHRLPEPGKVYAIPADTHADLDLQDDKERIFYRRGNSRNQFGYYRQRR